MYMMEPKATPIGNAGKGDGRSCATRPAWNGGRKNCGGNWPSTGERRGVSPPVSRLDGSATAALCLLRECLQEQGRVCRSSNG
jgi:hypothetical protein